MLKQAASFNNVVLPDKIAIHAMQSVALKDRVMRRVNQSAEHHHDEPNNA